MRYACSWRVSMVCARRRGDRSGFGARAGPGAQQRARALRGRDGTLCYATLARSLALGGRACAHTSTISHRSCRATARGTQPVLVATASVDGSVSVWAYPRTRAWARLAHALAPPCRLVCARLRRAGGSEDGRRGGRVTVCGLAAGRPCDGGRAHRRGVVRGIRGCEQEATDEADGETEGEPRARGAYWPSQ